MISEISIKSLKNRTSVKLVKVRGFTLIEMITVIILLGVMSVGITSFIGIATQTYVNASDRDELIASARFAIERMTRELRQALPNSARVKNFPNEMNCLEFVPIIASTSYTNIPTVTAANIIDVIEFNNINNQPYTCDATCNDFVSTYALNANEIYVNSSQIVGQTFDLASVALQQTINDADSSDGTEIWRLTLDNNVTVTNESPTQRLFIINQPVMYCGVDENLYRITNYNLNFTNNDDNFVSDFDAFDDTNYTSVLMAENVTPIFNITNATLTRNGVIQLNMTFFRENDINEEITFNHEINIANTP